MVALASVAQLIGHRPTMSKVTGLSPIQGTCLVCCRQSRTGRSTLDSGRWKRMCRAMGLLDTPLFTGGRATHTANCDSLRMAHCMAPVPLRGTCCGTRHGAPTCLSTRDKQSWQEAKKLYDIAWFCACEPTSRYGNRLSVPVSRL